MQTFLLIFIRFKGVSQPSHTFNCSASVFSSTIRLPSCQDIYLYNQFQGLRLSGLPLSHQHCYPTLSSALNIFSRRRISPSFKNDIIRLEAGAFKFLGNRLFMTSMQLPRKISQKKNMRYSAK